MTSERRSAASDAPTSDTSHGDLNWKERILMPAILGGLIGAGGGLISKHRKALGFANVCASYAVNSAIVTGCYCGVREFVKNTRASDPDDLVNSAIGGFATGAVLGRLQGGQKGAFRYSIIFGVAGPVFDLLSGQLFSAMKNLSVSSWQVPEWSPIQVLDEEALAAKRAREQKLYSQRILGDDTSRKEP